jgi:Holliday junction resolvase
VVTGTFLPVSKTSRDKGKRGEREVVNLVKASGLNARRTAPLQSASANQAADVELLDFPHLHVEVKRDERMSVDAMCRQAEGDVSAGHTPVVVYRRNNGPWRAVVPLSFLLDLLHDKVMQA